jgi:sugar transferase EpsL
MKTVINSFLFYKKSNRFPRRKRLFDILLILGTLPISVLLFIVVAVLVRCKIGSPIFFYQNRPGLGGKVYQMIKFRTMTYDRGSDGELLPDSRRLTRFGIWLRSTSLDELPELLNVLIGDMSLVGPRPLLVEYLGRYNVNQLRRHNLPPGITGWAQVSGRNALSWAEKLECDLWYIDHAGIWVDILILLRTLVTVFRRDGIVAVGDSQMPNFSTQSDDKTIGETDVL